MIYTSITVERKENYAIVQLDGGKVNEINTAMVRDLKHVFTVLDQDDSVRGIILSGRPHGFSAGLDIVNIAMGGKVKAEEFWNYYHEALQAMIKTFCVCHYWICPSWSNHSSTLCRLQGYGQRHKTCSWNARI